MRKYFALGEEPTEKIMLEVRLTKVGGSERRLELGLGFIFCGKVLRKAPYSHQNLVQKYPTWWSVMILFCWSCQYQYLQNFVKLPNTAYDPFFYSTFSSKIKIMKLIFILIFSIFAFDKTLKTPKGLKNYVSDGQTGGVGLADSVNYRVRNF